ncbi:MAG TPA: putative baseplate assembly protein [Ktedonobacteraceae bacterium]|nr:putative baseplate assembly protein [Ktedonobacteraceae bacterium]
MKTSEICNDERRRGDVRESNLQGLDYVEVSDDQLTLTVYFLGKAPRQLGPVNIQISGGRRVINIHVLKVTVHRNNDPELDDYMQVGVDKVGDFSTYTLRLVELAGYDKQGSPIYRRLHGFDNRYASVDFSFKAGCASDLDCKSVDSCPPAVYEQPEINYVAKDYASFRQLLLDRLSLTIPGWQARHAADVYIALMEILAYTGDYLSYYQDAVATEAYLDTARQRISVRRHARLVDYLLHEGCNARTWLYVNVSEDIGANTTVKIHPDDVYFITNSSATLEALPAIMNNRGVQLLPAGSYEAFEVLPLDPLEDPSITYLQFYAAHDDIWFYTWGDQECCLPRGATSATLQDYPHDPNMPDEAEEEYIAQEIAEDEEEEDEEDEDDREPQKAQSTRILNLKPGDFLLFEEVRGADTGLKQDALPTRRQVVRLTKVEHARDHLYDKNVLEVEWAVEDALLFPFCISNIGRAPDCTLFQNISVARGNLLLIDAGLTIAPAETYTVPVAQTIPACEGENEASDVEIIAGPFGPTLAQTPLTFSQPVLLGKPAAQMLAQDPRKAVPQITLKSTPAPEGLLPPAVRTWHVQPDLLESEPDDFDFVVEVDDNVVAHLRFGNNQTGRSPEPNEVFSAQYRLGNGPEGNVGPETITHIVFRNDDKPDGIVIAPRNPFAAIGGTVPEPLTEAKLFAPQAFGSELERAITANDYATLAQNYPGVQRAAASLRWNGSGYDVLVVIDPLGTETLSTTMRDGIALYLEQFRRIGHDVAVEQARYVSLELAMCVVVQPHYLRGHVEAALLQRFSNGLLPDGMKGFFNPDSLSFGAGIAVSTLVALAQAVEGVVSVEVQKLQRFGESPNLELQKGILEIGSLEIAQLDNDPNFPEHGTLKFAMKGGR